jgi:hypothetical protein
MNRRTCYLVAALTSLFGAFFLAAFLPEYAGEGAGFFIFLGGASLVAGAGAYATCKANSSGG